MSLSATGTAFVVDLSADDGIPQAVFTDIDEAKKWAERTLPKGSPVAWERETRTLRSGRISRTLFLLTEPETVDAVIREVPLNPEQVPK